MCRSLITHRLCKPTVSKQSSKLKLKTIMFWFIRLRNTSRSNLIGRWRKFLSYKIFASLFLKYCLANSPWTCGSTLVDLDGPVASYFLLFIPLAIMYARMGKTTLRKMKSMLCILYFEDRWSSIL